MLSMMVHQQEVPQVMMWTGVSRDAPPKVRSVWTVKIAPARRKRPTIQELYESGQVLN